MHSRDYAAAWETFKFPSHFQQVEPGDAIFAFAKGVGIIGSGRAKTRCEKLKPGDPDRLRPAPPDSDAHEWRVPVDWLAWCDDDDAFRYKSPNSTFWNVSEDRYSDLRKGIKKHFLSGNGFHR